MLQGGASLQFSMVPMNLLDAGHDGRLHRHRLVGRQGDQGGQAVGTVNVTGSTKADNYNRIPAQRELQLTPGAAYVHMTRNNTIEGTQWKSLPEVGDAPLVTDTSSDIFSGPIDVVALRR